LRCSYEYCFVNRKLNTIRNARKVFMDAITGIGLIAALLTTVSLLPQLIKVYKTKSTKDISTGMFSLFCAGVFLWFIYGVLVNDFPIIIANSLAFVQAVMILFFKVKYK
jgi:MtN3 and saliva related transmembrane protein